MHKALDMVVGIVIEFSLQGRLYVMMKGSQITNNVQGLYKGCFIHFLVLCQILHH